jgi:hypothetical protein
MQEKILTFNSASKIYLTSKERDLAFNFYKGSDLIIAQLFRSKDFKNGDWEGVGKLKENSNVLMLHFDNIIGQNEDFERFKKSRYYANFKSIYSKGQEFFISDFKVYYPFRVKKLTKKLREIIYTIYSFNEREQLEFTVVAY